MDEQYGLWGACPDHSTVALGMEGAISGGGFVPANQSVRGNPIELRAFWVEWNEWVWDKVQEEIARLVLDDELHGGNEEFTVYEDESNATKVVVGQKGQPGVLYLIAYKM